MRHAFTLPLALLVHAPFASVLAADPPATDFVEAEPSPAPKKAVTITVASPAKNQVLPADKAGLSSVKLSVKGWDLSPGGNHLCASLDGRPCVRIHDTKQGVKLSELDPELSDGQHVLVVVARRANNETVKPTAKTRPFAIVPFYVGKKVEGRYKDGAPVVVVGSPGDVPASAGAVLVDVLVANAEVAEGKYVLHVMASGPGLGNGKGDSVSSVRPYRIVGPRAGSYSVRFALFRYEADLGESSSTTTVRYAAKPVDGPFTDVSRAFRVVER
jgi:hypothetical protein